MKFRFPPKPLSEDGNIVLVDLSCFQGVAGRKIALSKHKDKIDDVLILWDSGNLKLSESGVTKKIKREFQMDITRQTLRHYKKNYFIDIPKSLREKRLVQLLQYQSLKHDPVTDDSKGIADGATNDIEYWQKILSKLERLANKKFDVAANDSSWHDSNRSTTALCSIISRILELRDRLYLRTAGMEVTSLVEKIAGDIAEIATEAYVPKLPVALKEAAMEDFFNKVQVQSEILISQLQGSTKKQSEMRKESKQYSEQNTQKG